MLKKIWLVLFFNYSLLVFADIKDYSVSKKVNFNIVSQCTRFSGLSLKVNEKYVYTALLCPMRLIRFFHDGKQDTVLLEDPIGMKKHKFTYSIHKDTMVSFFGQSESKLWIKHNLNTGKIIDTFSITKEKMIDFDFDYKFVNNNYYCVFQSTDTLSGDILLNVNSSQENKHFYEEISLRENFTNKIFRSKLLHNIYDESSFGFERLHYFTDSTFFWKVELPSMKLTIIKKDTVHVVSLEGLIDYNLVCREGMGCFKPFIGNEFKVYMTNDDWKNTTKTFYYVDLHKRDKLNKICTINKKGRSDILVDVYHNKLLIVNLEDNFFYTVDFVP